MPPKKAKVAEVPTDKTNIDQRTLPWPNSKGDPTAAPTMDKLRQVRQKQQQQQPGADGTDTRSKKRKSTATTADPDVDDEYAGLESDGDAYENLQAMSKRYKDEEKAARALKKKTAAEAVNQDGQLRTKCDALEGRVDVLERRVGTLEDWLKVSQRRLGVLERMWFHGTREAMSPEGSSRMDKGVKQESFEEAMRGARGGGDFTGSDVAGGDDDAMEEDDGDAMGGDGMEEEENVLGDAETDDEL
jgi:hypothetical protein